ncbi:MAG: tyrosine protein kinase [Streptococcaceae bacterium]|nr:tyrosine protein kinase [Streptococcaceae bacterium]
MEETVSLEEVLNIIKKRIALIVMLGIVGLGVTLVTTVFFIKPEYASKTELIVVTDQRGEQANNSTQSEINGNVLLINTYKDLIKSSTVLEEVSERLVQEAGIQLPVGTLNQMIAVTQTQNSQMFDISAKSPSAEVAEKVANETANVFSEKATAMWKGSTVSIISKAMKNETPVSPNLKLNAAIGLVAGLLIGLGLALVLELLDKTLKDSKFITETLGLPLLAEVSKMGPREIKATQLEAVFGETAEAAPPVYKHVKRSKDESEPTPQAVHPAETRVDEPKPVFPHHDSVTSQDTTSEPGSHDIGHLQRRAKRERNRV